VIGLASGEAGMSTMMLRAVAARRFGFLMYACALLACCLFAPAVQAAGKVAAADEVSVMSLPGVRPRFDDFDVMLKRRVIRVLVPPSRTMFFLDKGEAYGITIEFMREFEKWLNKKYAKKPFYIEVAIIPTHSDKLLEELKAGRGDIAAGNLTVTPERSAIVDFADPIGEGAKEVVVTGPSAPVITSIDDLGGHKVMVRKSSSYYQHLLAINDRLKKEGKPIIQLVPADPALEDEDLLEMVGAGLQPWTVVDLHIAKLWAKIYKNLDVHADLVVNDGGNIAWALRKNTPKLMAVVNAFMATHRMGTEFGNGLISQYLNDGRIVKNALTPERTQLLRELMVYFKEYGDQSRVDPFILAAQGFQESAFNQKLRMSSGAVGVMQMKPSTAKEELGIPDIVTRAEDNIHSAAAYLRFIIAKYISDPGVSDRDRVLMALAAYNGGPGALTRARADAKKKGFDPNVWFDNVEFGSAAVSGQEPVQYVGHIYKYFLSYRDLLSETRPEDTSSAQPPGK
jgi:membrane-bound lytic murein transglycosylase MltF